MKIPQRTGEAAKHYAEKFGWRVLPLHSMRPLQGGGWICSCNKTECEAPGKHPYVKNGEASNDVKQIETWWKKWPDANIGFWLEGSGLAALDIDVTGDKNGAERLTELLAGQSLPATLVCATPSGGKHIYYKDREGLPNKSNALGAGLDIWRGRHYLILPPSNHKADGKQYAWENDATPVEWPDVLIPVKRGVGRPRIHPEAPDSDRERGRPVTKERIDPYDKDHLAKLQHAMTFVDASDRDTWVHFGYIVARLFNWSEKGWEVFKEWSATAANYSEKESNNIYYKDSRNVPPEGMALTTAYIFKQAQGHPNFTRWEKSDARLKFFQSEGYEADDLNTLTGLVRQTDLEFYEREGRLIEVIRIDRMTEGERTRLALQGVTRHDSYCITRELTAGGFVLKASPHIAWWKRLRNKMTNTDYDRRVVGDFVNMGDWPGLKKFRAFVLHPTLRSLANPTILMQTGFDAESGLYLEQPLAVDLPTKAKLKHAQAAAKTLLSPFEYFAFLDGEFSKAGVLALILTIGLRHCFKTAPMFLATSPIAGSGKTKLMNACTTLWYGAPSPTMMYVENEEEMEKRVGASVMAGDRVMLFDNVVAREVVNDRTLSMILTSGMAQFRILGESTQVRMSAPMTIMMTGNQMVLGADLARRTIELRIDPQGPLPMARQFPWEPVEFVIHHRKLLVEAAMTILLAYFSDPKRPAPGPAVPSFEEWGIVRDIILWLGMDDMSKFAKPAADSDDLYYPFVVKRIVQILHDLKHEIDLGVQKVHPADILPLLLAKGKEWEALFHDAIDCLNYSTDKGAKHDDPRTVGSVLSRIVDQPVEIEGKRIRLKSIKKRLFWLETAE